MSVVFALLFGVETGFFTVVFFFEFFTILTFSVLTLMMYYIHRKKNVKCLVWFRYNRHMIALTPVEEHSGIYFKRDDYYKVADMCGGKARTCWHLAQGATGLITASSKSSPQAQIVAHIAKHLNIPCHLHMPWGRITEPMQQLIDTGAVIKQHKPGFNNLLIAGAKRQAEEAGYKYIPFGMECQEAIEQTAGQVENIPLHASRIVVPVGSGMSLAGITHGLQRYGLSIPVLGVRVGASPEERLDRYACMGWRETCQLVNSSQEYHEPADRTEICGIELDPYYEAKCLPFLQAGDIFWLVGIRS